MRKPADPPAADRRLVGCIVSGGQRDHACLAYYFDPRHGGKIKRLFGRLRRAAGRDDGAEDYGDEGRGFHVIGSLSRLGECPIRNEPGEIADRSDLDCDLGRPRTQYEAKSLSIAVLISYRSRAVMISIPLPFVASLFLITILVQMIRRAEGQLRESRFFMLLIGAYALQSVLIGIRWGYDIRAIMPAQAIVATIVAPLAWLSFRSLAAEGDGHSGRWIWAHFLPACLVALLLIVWPDPVGPLITLVFLGYGAALAWLARLGPDSLVASRLDGAVRSYRSLQVTAFAILASAVTDVVISYDFSWSGGRHTAAIIAAVNVVNLLMLGAAASVTSANTASEPSDTADEPAAAATIATEEDSRIAADVDSLMHSRELYRDVELNLAKIARRLHLPARQVSNAINRIHGMSVSQYVNNFRVRAACRLLESTDDPVTRIVFEAGFQTKSNFNREFLRVTGQSPTAWRQAHRQTPSNVARLERKAAS
jgi:AraC-like DNA-binding protein